MGDVPGFRAASTSFLAAAHSVFSMSWESPRFLVVIVYLVPWDRGIATTSLRTGLAMTGNLEAERQTPTDQAAGEIGKRVPKCHPFVPRGQLCAWEKHFSCFPIDLGHRR